MHKVFHTSDSRGRAEHGWLKSRHTFSFAGYHNPERVRFGLLRVLNDDVVQGGAGFATHSHDNMEIVSVPLQGALRHKDSMGNTHVIRSGEVQIMSAGTGVTHSEYNASESEGVNFLQIWVLPKQRDIAPAYGQQDFPAAGRTNRLQTVISPAGEDNSLTIHQDAWFSLLALSAGGSLAYELRRPQQSGVYTFAIKGEATVAGEQLKERDAVGVWDAPRIDIHASDSAELLLMEVPMQ